MTPKQKPYRIDFAEAIRKHLGAIDGRLHRDIFDTIDEQLRHQPSVETRNRKPMERPTSWGIGMWELRFGPSNELRVYYKIDEKQHIVNIVAIGVKVRNRLVVGGQEVEL